MRQRFLLILNSVTLVFAVLFFIQLESTIWFQLFGHIPSPMLWLLATIYVSVYRTASEGLLLIYFFSIAVSVYTSKPLVLICALNVFILISIRLFKSRIYWEGFRFFALVTVSSCLNFQIADLCFSYFFENYIFDNFHLLQRFMVIFLTSIFSFPVYKVLLSIDKITEKDRFSLPGSHAI